MAWCAACSPSSSIARGRSSRAILIIANELSHGHRDRLPAGIRRRGGAARRFRRGTGRAPPGARERLSESQARHPQWLCTPGGEPGRRGFAAPPRRRILLGARRRTLGIKRSTRRRGRALRRVRAQSQAWCFPGRLVSLAGAVLHRESGGIRLARRSAPALVRGVRRGDPRPRSRSHRRAPALDRDRGCERRAAHASRADRADAVPGRSRDRQAGSGGARGGLRQCAHRALPRSALRDRDAAARDRGGPARTARRVFPGRRARRPAVVYLASRSPRRRELLLQMGVRFEPLQFREGQRQDEDTDEAVRPGEQPDDYVRRVTRLKAEAAWKRVVMRRGLQRKPVLAADTTVALAGEILGKPADRADADRILRTLSGTQHRVLTAIALAFEERLELAVSQSLVTLAFLDDARIASYVQSGEPFDKAGAYAIQGRAGAFVSRLEGSYTGVMGLPLYETGELLRKFGIVVP